MAGVALPEGRTTTMPTGSHGDAAAAAVWQQLKSPVVVPLLRLSVALCLAMSVMLLAEKAYMAAVVLATRLLGHRRRPDRRYRWEPIGDGDDDVEAGGGGGGEAYPMVLVQIPMYNEREVYQVSIGAACGLSWPADRIIVQVLDDSTDPVTKELVRGECERWASKGVDVRYEVRDSRRGYKAGALREGMKRDYARGCDLVAIFDADFQPEPGFLRRAVPFLIHNPELALVQARWTFVNADECLMTRMQEMSLDYHFTVEQEVGSSIHAFFGFNGTAGVWRISALNEAGGWKDRTTVEDMDLAVRASLKGWKFVFLGDLMKVTLWKKIHVIYNFFLVRKIIAHIVTFVFYCIVIPATVLVPEVEIPRWGSVYIPTIITLLNAVGTPRSFHLIVFWVLFENVMSLHRTKATFIGLLEAGRVNEWVVTEKLGDALRMKLPGKGSKKLHMRIGDRLHILELGVAAYLFFCGCYDVAFGNNHYYIFLFLQSIAFFVVGVGYIGTFVPLS
nr:unnamed protein product [Digitaria exilis]